MALTPSSIQAPTNYNFVSSMDLITNIHRPEISTSLTQRYGNQNITGFMQMQGAINPVAAIEYTHFEEDWIHSIVKVENHSAGAADTPVTLSVQATYQYTYPGSAQSPYIEPLPSVTTNPLRLYDIVQFPDGTQAMVTTRDAAGVTFEVTPTQLGANIPAVTTSTQLIITGNAHEEQTGQPASRNSRVIRYVNNLQIMKDTHTASGTEMGVQTWFELKDQNGKTGYLWYFKGQLDTYTRFENECEIQMLLGEKITSTVLATALPTTTITEGLIPFIANYGNNETYSGITGIQLADFEGYVLALDRNRGSKENTLWCGMQLSQGIDAFMRDTMKNGAISYGAFEGSREKAISFNFASFELTGYTFHKKTYDLFNHPQLLGAAGQPYLNMGLVIPTGNVAATFEPGAKGKVSVPSLRMNYLEGKGNAYSRNSEEWLLGGVNGVYNNDLDQQTYNLRGHRGFEGFAPNRFMKIQKA